MKAFLIVAVLSLFPPAVLAQAPEEKLVLEEKEILKAEQAWLDASKSFDEDSFQRVLREDYIGVDIDGRVQNKVDLLKAAEEIASGHKKASPQKRSLNAIRVRVYTDVAVVAGGMIEGGPKGFAVRFSHVWVKANDQWQLSTSQVTRVTLTRP